MTTTMRDTSPSSSMIPVSRRRLSVTTPATPGRPQTPGQSGSRPSSVRRHRRQVSTLSTLSTTSTEDGTTLRVAHSTSTEAVAKAHAKLAASLTGADNGSLNGPTSPYGDTIDTGDAYVSDVDRIRAPTMSSLQKQRDRVSHIPHLSGSTSSRRRTESQTDTQSRNDERLGLSRIPRTSVSNAVLLHSNGPRLSGRATSPWDSLSDTGDGLSYGGLMGPASPLLDDGQTSASSLQSPEVSPMIRGRASLGPTLPQSRGGLGASAKSSKMIEALQTELEITRQHLDRVKQEVRNCRREIGALTRKSEDLRETKDRMRSETESLTNVIARKERMVNEVLARARTAEAQVTQLTAERKDMEANSKKMATDAQAEVAEAVGAKAKAESERNALQDSVQSLKDMWARDVKSYQDELAKAQDHMREELEESTSKQAAVMELIQRQAEEHENVIQLVKEANAQHAEAKKVFEEQVSDLRSQVTKNAKDSASAQRLARTLAGELARLRRLAKQPPRPDLEAILSAEVSAEIDEVHTAVNRVDGEAPVKTKPKANGHIQIPTLQENGQEPPNGDTPSGCTSPDTDADVETRQAELDALGMEISGLPTLASRSLSRLSSPRAPTPVLAPAPSSALGDLATSQTNGDSTEEAPDTTLEPGPSDPV